MSSLQRLAFNFLALVGITAVLVLSLPAFSRAGEAKQVRLRPHETTTLHVGQTAVLELPSQSQFERDYYDATSEPKKAKLPVISKRHYQVELAGDALTAIESSSCKQSNKTEDPETEEWFCNPAASIVYRAVRSGKAIFVVTPTAEDPHSQHCDSCVTTRYFVDIVR